MANEHSTNEDKQKLDHLQDDFNALISEDEPYAEATDAFNDLAGAFAADDSSESSHQQDQKPSPANLSHHGGEHDDFVAHLNKSINELKATASASNTPDPITEDDLPHDHTRHPDFDLDEFKPMQDSPPFTSPISEQDSESLFEDEMPVYADLSGDVDNESRPKSHIIAFASAILIATAGGIYWYTTGSVEQPTAHIVQNEHVIEGEQLKLPEQATPPNNTTIPATLSTADAIKLVTQQHVQQQTTKKIASIKKTPSTNPPLSNNTTADKPTPDKAAASTTTTAKPIKTKAVKQTVQSVSIAQPISKRWIIVAAVDSNKLARQYMARLHSKHLDSEIVQLKSNGETRHFIRIKGFSTQHSAQNKRDSLVKTLGLQNARVQAL